MIRRNFLRTLLCGPLVAKVAVENKFAEEMNLDISGFKHESSLLGSGGVSSSGSVIESIDYRTQALTYFKTFGIPKYEKEKIFQECNYVRDLDPDIAVKKSWSLNVKIAHQRERNRKKSLENSIKSLEYSLAKDLFQKTTGWSYWF